LDSIVHGLMIHEYLGSEYGVKWNPAKIALIFYFVISYVNFGLKIYTRNIKVNTSRICHDLSCISSSENSGLV
jgi:hypothetical protein